MHNIFPAHASSSTSPEAMDSNPNPIGTRSESDSIATAIAVAIATRFRSKFGSIAAAIIIVIAVVIRSDFNRNSTRIRPQSDNAGIRLDLRVGYNADGGRRRRNQHEIVGEETLYILSHYALHTIGQLRSSRAWACTLCTLLRETYTVRRNLSVRA